jgi:hypothetical protein
MSGCAKLLAQPRTARQRPQTSVFDIGSVRSASATWNNGVDNWFAKN